MPDHSTVAYLLPSLVSILIFIEKNRLYSDHLSALLAHLHSDDFQAKLPVKDKPWKKRLEIFNATLRGKTRFILSKSQIEFSERDAIKESLKETVDLAKGSEFFVPVQAFKCKLCEKIFRTEADAQAHFLSAAHNEKYDQFKAQNPNYELLR